MNVILTIELDAVDGETRLEALVRAQPIGEASIVDPGPVRFNIDRVGLAETSEAAPDELVDEDRIRSIARRKLATWRQNLWNRTSTPNP